MTLKYAQTEARQIRMEPDMDQVDKTGHGGVLSQGETAEPGCSWQRMHTKTRRRQLCIHQEMKNWHKAGVLPSAWLAGSRFS